MRHYTVRFLRYYFYASFSARALHIMPKHTDVGSWIAAHIYLLTYYFWRQYSITRFSSVLHASLDVRTHPCPSFCL